MNFLLDNNLSPRLARALNELCAGEPEEIEVVHLRDKFPPDIPDIDWINALAADKDWSVVTRDRIIKNPLEKEAFRQSGLTAFILVKTWKDHGHWELAAQMVRWWPRIMEQASLISGGAAFEVPWRISGKGQFTQLKI